MRLLAGAGVVGLVLAGYAYSPAIADRIGSSAEPVARAQIAPVQLAQVSSDVQKQIPLPEPATVAPPSAADLNPAKPAAPSVEALVPLPEPANVAPITIGDIAPEKATTTSATADAPAPAQAATPAPATEASAPSTPAPTDTPTQQTSTPTPEAAPAQQTSTPTPEAAPAQQTSTPTPEAAPAQQTSTPAPEAAPAQQTSTPAPEAEPQLDAEAIKQLTGKDLIKAPLAASLAVADTGIAEKLRELVSGRLDRIVSRREDRQAVEAFYRDRGFAPLWIENGSRAARTSAAIKHLSTIDADGLEPADYPVPDFNAPDAQALAEAELRFTNSILDYARHAQTGRVHFSRISGDVHYDLAFPEPANVLAKLAATNDVAPVLAAFNPQHEGYKALKAKLAELRGQAPEAEIVRVPEGPTLKPGMEDARVAVLRKRLDVAGDRDDYRYDEDVAEAVIQFQRNAGLRPDGLVGPATLRALNGVRRTNKMDAIIATMERWRWMPRDLGRNYSMLNIPDFSLKVVQSGTPIWQTRVVVGKTNTKTPLLSDTMKFITVNPTWNVPPSIIANEYLPALQQDPTVLERMGLRLDENRDGTVRIYQPPGDSNALGRLRFNFPNKFLVYQHDTPDKHLFARDARAYSHGCMRVQDPVKYAEVLLSLVLPNGNYSEERIRSMFGPGEINIKFPTPLAVHITYQTAFVEDDKLVVRNDVYGHDAALMAQLRGTDRRVADVPITRRQVAYSKEELRLPNGTYYGGFDGRGPYRSYDGRRPYRTYGGGGPYGRNPVEDFFRSIFR